MVKKKRMRLWAAFGAIAAMIIVFIAGSQLLRQPGMSKTEDLLPGTWYCEVYDGNGTEYCTFTEEGSVSIRYEVPGMEDDELMTSQDLGTMQYRLKDEGTLQITTSVMGVSSTQEFSLAFEGDDVLVIESDKYYRYNG